MIFPTAFKGIRNPVLPDSPYTEETVMKTAVKFALLIMITWTAWLVGWVVIEGPLDQWYETPTLVTVAALWSYTTVRILEH
ncbi:MAG: hypothetical protein KAJ03_04080 [Gammaproteobacteria bacterium]|nr:hypothetical protein [Gammaproteobacteria bacterium]